MDTPCNGRPYGTDCTLTYTLPSGSRVTPAPSNTPPQNLEALLEDLWEERQRLGLAPCPPWRATPRPSGP